MREDISELIDIHSTSMSKFQIKHFVLGDKITDYRIVKQLLMEIETRNNAIEEENLIVEETNIKIKYADKKSNIDTEEGELAKIESKRLKNSLKVSSKRLLGLTYELEELEKTFDLMAEHTDIKSLVNNEDEESEFWITKFTRDAQFDIMTTGKLQKGLLEAMSTLPGTSQERIVSQALHNSALSNGYLAGAQEIAINGINNDNDVKAELTFDTVPSND